MSKLYAVKAEPKTAPQPAGEAAQPHLPSLDSITVREGAGMHWLPSTFRRLWNMRLEHRPVPGEVERLLYGKNSS